MLKIWGRNTSSNVQKVIWALAEMKLPFERIDVGGAFGKTKDPFYLAMNPNSLVPTLEEDDGYTMWESNSIVRYLAAKHATGSLMPADPVMRAKAEMWMDWQQTALLGFGPLFVGLIRTPPEKRDMAVIRAGQDNTEVGLRLLDGYLANRRYMIADHLTVADIPLGCVAYRWYALPIGRPELPHLRAWYRRLTERPGFAQNVMLPLT